VYKYSPLLERVLQLREEDDQRLGPVQLDTMSKIRRAV